MQDTKTAGKLNRAEQQQQRDQATAPAVSASPETPETVTASPENVTATAENVPDICSPVIDVQAVTQRAEPFLVQLAESWGIDDIVKGCKQSQWSALMIQTGKHLFPVRPIDPGYLFNPYTGEQYTYKPHQYNDNAIDLLADYYINLCMRYAKLVSVIDFEYFIAVPFQTVEQWGIAGQNSKSRDRVARKRYSIAQKLRRARHESLKQRAADNGNVTGVIFVANSEYADASPAVQRERAALTARELPRLQAMPGAGGGAVLLPGGGQ